ncbi:lipocalin-like domain-containing protein [Kordia periserrulae]|nr:lipocalin family protein [Kordia periserrulae]
MKKILCLFVATSFLFSCASDDNTETPEEVSLIGNWKLIERLVDPGDGSGTFIAITSDKTVTFNSNGEVTSNYSLCNMLLVADQEAGTGTYSADTGVLNVTNCDFDLPFPVNFEISTEGKLLIHYPCIEGCSEKYEKEATP